MIAVVGAITLVTLLVGAALAATNADLGLVKRDLDDKRAYAAAQSGIADYSYHLNNDTGYWTRCTNVPIPARGQPAELDRPAAGGARIDRRLRVCNPAAPGHRPDRLQPERSGDVDAGDDRGEHRHLPDPLHRVRRQDEAVDRRHLQAGELPRLRLLHASSRPPTRSPTGSQTPPPRSPAPTRSARSSAARAARAQSIPNSGGQDCDRIVFVSGDDIDGPLHTNDDLADLRHALLRALVRGRDRGERAAGRLEQRLRRRRPNFVGPFVTNAPVLTPPPTNTELRTIAGPSYTYTGQTRIKLTEPRMRINGGLLGIDSRPAASSTSPTAPAAVRATRRSPPPTRPRRGAGTRSSTATGTSAVRSRSPPRTT